MSPSTSDLELMYLQVQNLFRLDGEGRLLSTNEAPPFTAPRLFLGRTVEGNVWRLRHDLPSEQAKALTALLGAEPAPAGLEDEPVALPKH